MIWHKLNGYTVTAAVGMHPAEGHEPGSAVILAVREPLNVADRREYVTAVVSLPSEGQPPAREWYWGHYFNDAADAMRDFVARSGLTRVLEHTDRAVTS